MSVSLARPAILRLRAYQSARSLSQEGRIFLDANESPISTSPFSTLDAPLNRYPDPQPVSIKKRLAEIYHVSADRILMGRGADEAIDLLVRTFCEPKTDRILICPPTYGMYEVSAQIQDAGICRVPLRQSDFQLDGQAIAEELAREQSAPVKLVFICSPNNPTGTAFDRQTISNICEMAIGKAIVVVDEAYAEFDVRTQPDGSSSSQISEVSRFPNLVVLRTLSKAWAMAGVRCGVAIAQEPIIQLLQKVRAPYPLSLPAIQAIQAGIDETQERYMKDRVGLIRKERERLVVELLALKEVERVYSSEANFVLVKFKNAKKAMDLTRAQGVILRDRSSEPGLEDCVRISIGSEAENQVLISILKQESGI